MKKTIIIFSAVFGMIFQSCSQKEKPKQEEINLTLSEEFKMDEGSLCPYLTEDNNGNTVLSRILDKGDNEYILAYSVSADGGKTFGETIEIPHSTKIHPHEENIPKIVFKPSGEIIAAWPEANPNEKNKYSDIIYFSTSSDNGKTWSDAQRLVPEAISYDQRYFDFAVLPSGEVGISWLDERKIDDKEGSGLYFSQTNGGVDFEDGRLIGGPGCECCRTKLFVDSKKDIHLIYREIVQDSIRDIVHKISKDQGKTFSESKRISDDNWVIYACPHTGPSMTEVNGNLQFTWFTGGVDGGIYYNNSKDDGNSFSPRSKVSNGITVMHSQMANLGDNAGIVWDENLSDHHNTASAIGIELRDKDGNNLTKKYITSETGEAGFPVIKKIGENSVIVAYTKNENDKDFVSYKIVSL